jgi:3-methyladenine DNA glycosylase AlkC
LVPEVALSACCTDTRKPVTRSVSNHLNDIAKTHPEPVIDLLTRWKTEGRQDPAELKWMSKHVLRTLVKRGDSKALKLLGFRPNPKIEVSDFALVRPAIGPGDTIKFSFFLMAHRDESLMVD